MRVDLLLWGCTELLLLLLEGGATPTPYKRSVAVQILCRDSCGMLLRVCVGRHCAGSAHGNCLKYTRRLCLRTLVLPFWFSDIVLRLGEWTLWQAAVVCVKRNVTSQ